MRILFRTDGSLVIGTGHVMRCLTLAQGLRGNGVECKFICRGHLGHLLERIREAGFEAIDLPLPKKSFAASTGDTPVLAHADWLETNWQSDARETIAALGRKPVDWLIVDHYALDRRWESQLRPHVKKIMAIDDLADREHDCDLLMDQNLVANLEHRYDALIPANCLRLLGLSYALLQPSYAELYPRTPPRLGPVRRILLFFGGADQFNLTGMAINAFLALQRADIELDVVINPVSSHADAVREQVRGYTYITLHENLPSLAPLMVRVDLAIGAGGSTSWERCCLGLPTLVITIAEHQRAIAAKLHEEGFVHWLGHGDVVTELDLTEAIVRVLDDGGLQAWSQRCASMVDGKGVERIISILMLSENVTLQARLARLEDEAFLLQWANDPMVRQSYLIPELIDEETHRNRLYGRLQEVEHCRLYIVETEAGLAIGQVCFECIKGAWDIDFSMAAEARGKKLGNRLLQTAMAELRRTETGALVFGQVEAEDNNPFYQLEFEELGFSGRSEGSSLSISICSDADSWINASIPALLLEWIIAGHSVSWAHDADCLSGGDVCFYWSYGHIVGSTIRSNYLNSLVVHASDLPKGKGWSPLTWQILEGHNRIPITLIEAADQVDSGTIYAQNWLQLDGHELVDELRYKLAAVTFELCRNFITHYPDSATKGLAQSGKESFYPSRGPADSRLDPDKSIADQLDLLRVVDNERYPAFFEKGERCYTISIHSASTTDA